MSLRLRSDHRLYGVSAMATDLGWMSGHTSSIDNTIISILFLIVYVILYTLCSTCFSETPECPEEKENPSSLSLSVNLEDHWSTNRTTSNVDAKSDSYFSRETTPRIPDTPEFSLRSTGSTSPELPALPPIPPLFYFSAVQLEPPMVSASSSFYSSSSRQRLETDKSVWECVTPPPEDINSVFMETVSEEHPYECIDNVRVSGPSSSSPCDEDVEERWENGSPYHTVAEWTDPIATYDLATPLPVTDGKKAEELKFIFPPLPAIHDEKMNTDRTALYAEVNLKNKSRKSTEEAPVVQDTVVSDEDEAPPLPIKIFD
ncbi:hypothetical protein Q7C36_002988 [Tachysurus vachellii]|uniref:Uncharacterized protein n=1 Tax=Tachysurus vachellii TaxID=175792 RepID=A0AA88T708_TACVA|nr:uncharacterized protein LOC132842375 [Tachysurus vachellii]KAK2863834.1 hypothetical protein Q7C36_002988 [Tachysurus vachellii]